MSKTRGVRGAAGWCAIAAILYLLARSLLYAGISALVGVVHPGASLAKPIGVSEVGLGLLQIVIAVGAALVPLLWMLRGTRLQTDDLRITVPAPWSPAFCLPVFLGVASTANLCGGLLVRLAGAEDAATLLPSGGAELFGLCEAIADTLKVPCSCAEDPQNNVVIGCGRALENMADLGKFLDDGRRRMLGRA